MFSTPKKAINKYRVHPVLGSPLKWLGLCQEDSMSPNLPSGSSSPSRPPPTSPSPMSSPIRHFPQHRPSAFPKFRAGPTSPRHIFSTDPPPTKHIFSNFQPNNPFYPTINPPANDAKKPGPSRVSAPFKLGRHRSQLSRQKSIRSRHAPSLKRTESRSLFSVEHETQNLFSVEREAKELLQGSNALPTPDDEIFIRETSKMAAIHNFQQSLKSARVVADNAVNLEEFSAAKRAKAREQRARREAEAAAEQERQERHREKVQKTHSTAWLENYRLKHPRPGPLRFTHAERLVYMSERKAAEQAKQNQKQTRRTGFRGQDRLQSDRDKAHRQFLRDCEQKKRAWEIQREAERRRAEQEALERAQERQRQLEEEIQREQQRLVEEERFREQLRLAEEERLHERQRLEEEERLRLQREAQARRQKEEEMARRRVVEEARQREVEEAERRRREDAQAGGRAYWQSEFRRSRARSQFSVAGDEPMDVDEEPRVAPAAQPPTAEAIFAENERKWDLLLSDKARDVRFYDLPWPILQPGPLTNENLIEFVGHPARPGFQGKALKARLKVDILRWHPDKFTQKHLKKIFVEDREVVLEAVNQVARILIDLSSTVAQN